MGPTVTDWIDAATGVLTLAAAVAAGVFARNAAHWTKEQAQSAKEGVDVANHALAVARGDAEVARVLAEEQRRESEAASRRVAEDRVDARMPTVLVRATPGSRHARLVQRGRHGADGWDWKSIDTVEELTDADLDGVVFRLTTTINIENLSDQIARVALVDPSGGDHDISDHEGLLVRPHDQESFTWRRDVSARALRTDEDVHQQAIARPKLWVRDLGYNAYDIVDVVLDLRVFALDGSRLRVLPESALPWLESFGTPLPGRVYDRLNAQAPTD